MKKHHSSNYLKESLDIIEDVLPQTQCTKCGFPCCRDYAKSIVSGKASYNQCPPGGIEGVERLAKLLGRKVIPINPKNGLERQRSVALIKQEECIGCTLCILACPVDAIIGAAKQIHTVIPDLCTGCDLCISPCPVDCIEMLPITPGKTGWSAWSAEQANMSKARFNNRIKRIERENYEKELRFQKKLIKNKII